MEHSGVSGGIRRFDGTGYEVWSTLMDVVLTAKKIGHVLKTDRPQEDANGKIWDNDDHTARATILLALEYDLVKLVLPCSTAKDVWNRLKDVHSQQSESCKMILYQQFYSIMMEPGAKVSTYVADTELIVRKMKDAGIDITDDNLASKIVSGLTPDYKNFMSSWMSTPEKDRTVKLC